MAAESNAAATATSTQNTQYDKIGTKYNKVHVLAAVEPERPSVIAALGDIKGAKCLGEFWRGVIGLQYTSRDVSI
jgi:hypothetical protein